MAIYLNLVLAGFFLGLMDWLLKGLPVYHGKKWADLSRFKRGFSWPIMFFVIWAAVVFAFVSYYQNPWYWLGLILFINEDGSYYIYKRIVCARTIQCTYWNSWMGIWKSSKSYWWTVIIVNAIMAGVIMSIGAL